MGEVFRAHHRTSGTKAAIKVLGPGADEARFEQEAQVLSTLRHPRIVRYVGHGRTDQGAPYLAMQWLEGEDLAHRLDAGGGLSAQDAVRVATHVAEALAAAHALDVVHRDVKPSNVFLREGDVENAVLIDFGLARSRTGRRATQAGAVLGTPEYMAPEQAKGELDLDARVDVFALGCLLFECLTGRTPFAAAQPMAVLA